MPPAGRTHLYPQGYECISEPLQGATMDDDDLACEDIDGCADTYIVAKANPKARKARANESPSLY